MDRPRTKPPGRRALGVVIAGGAALLIGSGSLGGAASAALDLGSRAGLRLLGCTPPAWPGAGHAAPETAADETAWLGTRSTPQQADDVPSHSGGLFHPEYTSDNDLRVPDGYREWVFVGGASGLAYGEPATTRPAGAPGTFTHVYLEPSAFRTFRQSGRFPEGTTFALEMREPTGGVSIATDGWFAGRRTGVHFAVKDTARLGGWAYFNVESEGLARQERSSRCSSCHLEHGAVDNVFVQFYPALTEP